MGIAEESNEENIISVDLSATQKKKYRMIIDPNKPELNKILEINTSDLGIVDRMNSAYKELKKFEVEAQNLLAELDNLAEVDEDNPDDTLGKNLETVSKNLTTIDKKMRNLLDKIFDTNVSEICAPFGSMYDPINGKLRYEYILDKLTNMYESGLSSEIAKIKRNTDKHTSKYVGKKK